jgi:uncharacterized protein YbaP (TraB family)
MNFIRGFWWAVAAAAALSGTVVARAETACPPPLPAAAETAPAQDRGLLWRVSQGGHSSWLFGTIHVGKPAWKRLGPRTAAALKASTVLALEIDPADPALAGELTAKVEDLVVPPALQARLQQAYDRACIVSASLATLHPVLQATTLSVLEARWLGLDVAYAQELLLAAQARQQGRAVVALETAAQQKAALLPGEPADALNSLQQSLAQLEDGSGRRVLARMVQAWEAGDLETLAQYEQWCECAQTEDDRAAMRRLNDERNPLLADGIAARHKAGKRVFAAVGALHMTGQQALPLLLAQRGFKVERVAFAR